jgi:hypothetical protein
MCRKITATPCIPATTLVAQHPTSGRFLCDDQKLEYESAARTFVAHRADIASTGPEIHPCLQKKLGDFPSYRSIAIYAGPRAASLWQNEASHHGGKPSV